MKPYLQKLLIMALAVFAPIKGMLITVFILILADLVFGVIAAKKRGEAITSSGIRRTVTKFFIYEVTLMICFLAETYLLDGLLPVSKMLAGVIGMVELKSVLEAVNEINGGDIFVELLKRLGSKNDDIKPN
jgi:hypothetical protein